MFSNKRVIENISLINSMTIKMSSIAKSMNTELKQFGVIYDEEDLTTWPYYKNIAGIGHSANTTMYFVSIDTNEEIELTASNLAIHQRSKAELLLYSVYFSDLVKKYSGQEIYIRGILQPVNIDVAIKALDGEILAFNDSFLDYNETSVIKSLSDASVRFIDRWDVSEYALIENLYAASIYGVLINFLIVKLHLIRLENISTVEISESYISDTLDSHMGVGKYSSVLNRSSRLWLAKTIKYISYNIGKELTMDIIDENLMKPNGVSMHEINAIQSSPINLLSEDPTVDNTVYTDSVLYTVLKNGTNITKEQKLLSELNGQSFIDETVAEDYSQGSFRYDETRKKLIESDIDERSKFYVLQKNEDMVMSIYSRYDIIVDSIAIMFNELSGYNPNGESELLTDRGFRYSIRNDDLFSYLLYGIGRESGYSDTDIINGKIEGDILNWTPSSLIRHDFDIDAVLRNLHDIIPEYRLVLTAIKEVLLNPATTHIIDYIDSQIKAQSILGSCVTRIGGPVQEAELLSILRCITIGAIPMVTARSYGDLIANTKTGEVYPDYSLSNVLDVLTALSGSDIDKNAKTIKVLESLIGIVQSLTSYTTQSISNLAFSDEFSNYGKIGVLDNELVVLIRGADARCGVVSASIEEAIGNDEQFTIDVLAPSSIYSESDNNRTMDIFVDVGTSDIIRTERPILISE